MASSQNTRTIQISCMAVTRVLTDPSVVECARKRSLQCRLPADFRDMTHSLDSGCNGKGVGVRAPGGGGQRGREGGHRAGDKGSRDALTACKGN